MRNFFLLSAAIFFLCAVQTALSEKPVKNTTAMSRIPTGSFKPFYKNPNEPEKIRVGEFLMDEHAVTNAQFLDFVRKYPDWRRSRVKKIFSEKGYLEAWQSDTSLGKNILPNSPVTSISWFAAKKYCECEGKELPTTAQWEYAAFADVSGKKLGEDLSKKILDWYSKPTPKIIPPVKTTYKNSFGLYDMHGLIWEWVKDFNSAMISADDRAKGSESKNLFCGSGTVNSSDFKDYAAYMRYGLRGSIKARSVIRNLGFRCVKNAEKKK